MYYHNHILRGSTIPLEFIYSVNVGALETISLPMFNGDDSLYDFIVNFGDGSGNKSVSAYGDLDREHEYTLAGTYEITITGQFDYILFVDSPLSIVELKSWGTSSIGNSSFNGCDNFSTMSATDSPGMYLDDLLDCFRDCPLTSVNASIGGWDVSPITKMSNVFRGGQFNQSINNWDMSNVTTIANIFFGNTAYNQDMSLWDTSSITTMANVFNGASSFNQSLNSWDFSSVTSMASMFVNASSFNNGGVALNWASTGIVTNMVNLFNNADSFNVGVSSLNTSSATNMTGMFNGCAIFNQDVSDWDVSSAITMNNMFRSCPAFNNGGASLDWADSSSVTTMDGMFASATSFNQAVMFDTSSVTDMDVMFQNATSFDQDVSGFNVTALTTAVSMFLNVTLSTVNYDALLVGWEAQSVMNTVTFHGGNSTYTGAGAGGTARAALIADHSWTITDGGSV